MTNIVFDFGAVLFSWRPDLLAQQFFPVEAATKLTAQALGTSIFHHEDWLSYDRGVFDLDTVAAGTAARLSLPLERVYSLMSSVGESLEPIPETVSLLMRLHQKRVNFGKIKLYYLSNMPVACARELERRHQFISLFDGGIFSGDVQVIKPHIKIYELLQSNYGLEPEKTVFIDDSLANVKAAEQCGWQGLHFVSAKLLESHLEGLSILDLST